MLLLPWGELGLAGTELAGGFDNGHALTGASPDEVGLKLGNRAQDVEQATSRPTGSVGS